MLKNDVWVLRCYETVIDMAIHTQSAVAALQVEDCPGIKT